MSVKYTLQWFDGYLPSQDTVVKKNYMIGDVIREGVGLGSRVLTKSVDERCGSTILTLKGPTDAD